jgi:hypothetical protein
MEDNKSTTVETAANETETKGKGITIGTICKWTAIGVVAVGAVIGGIILFRGGAADAVADAADTVAE